MADSDHSTESEPLIATDEVRSSSARYALDVRARHVPKIKERLGIRAIFVVAFDTKHGNIIEWCKPEFMKDQLAGLEFKALPSGAHNLQRDMVYLYDADLYGVASYAKLTVDSTKERGARMKSVGVLSQHYDLLHIHKPKLVELVRHLLDNPTDYSQLLQYYELWSGSDNMTPHYTSLSDMSYPGRYFEHLLHKLGPSIFTVWKAMILQKRIMFYGQPPAAELCHIVRCSDLMMTSSDRLRSNICIPFFFVNIADCDVLSRQVSYIACTTEKVFETKTSIYDVYIDNFNVSITTTRMKSILKPTNGDKLRLSHLLTVLSQPVSCDDNPMTVEDNFFSYFAELNRAIADELNRLTANDETSLSFNRIRAMGLDISDSAFINELLDSVNLDISVGSCSLCECLPG